MKIKDIVNMLSEKKYYILLYIIIIILINLVGSTLYFRLDLTRNGAYSLSDISKDVVSSLEDPLTIKVFFTEDLPAPYNAVYRYIADVLEEYSQYGNRNFHYEFIDVEKQMAMASDFGVYPVQVREIKDDQVKLRNAYMGLVIVHGDLVEKLESITQAEGVEYRITSLMKKMIGKIDSLLKLEAPIRVTLYASSDLPLQGMKDINEKVEAVVKKSSSKNFDKITYRYVDPSVEKDLMSVAETFGLPPIRWPSFTSMTGQRVKAGSGIIGIVVENGDAFETIGVLSRNIFGQIAVSLDDLEDRINSAIDNLININPKIGYIAGHDEKDLDDENMGVTNFRKLISDMYDFEVIDLTKNDIPDDITTIVVNGPKKGFAELEIFKIDQFLMKGKSAIFLIDSFIEVQSRRNQMFGRQPMVLPVNTGLEKMLASYGIIVNKDLVLDQNCFKTTHKIFGEQKIYFAPLINEEGLHRDNVITRYLKRIFFLKAASLDVNQEVMKNQNIKDTVLVSSSSRSWLMRGRINFNPMMMRPPDESRMNSHKLALLLSGEFESFFKDREAPKGQVTEKGKKEKGTPTSVEVVEKSVKPVRIIVIGTSEVTANNIIDKDGKSPNAIFLHNAIDYLNGNYDIPEMRTKGIEFNPLKEAGEGVKLTIKIVNIVGLPVLVILIGLLMWKLRIMRKKRIMIEFGGEAADE